MNAFETDTITIVAILRQMLPMDRFKTGSLINTHWRKFVSAYFKFPMTWHRATRLIQRNWLRATNRNYTSVVRNAHLEAHGIFTVVYHIQVKMPIGLYIYHMTYTPDIAMFHVCAETSLSQPLEIYLYTLPAMTITSSGTNIATPTTMPLSLFDGLLSRSIEWRKHEHNLIIRPYINASRIDNNAITFVRTNASSALSVCVRFYGYTVDKLFNTNPASRCDPITGSDFERWRLLHQDTLCDLQKNIAKNDIKD
jgi:hypothetical protein